MRLYFGNSSGLFGCFCESLTSPWDGAWKRGRRAQGGPSAEQSCRQGSCLSSLEGGAWVGAQVHREDGLCRGPQQRESLRPATSRRVLPLYEGLGSESPEHAWGQKS